MTGKTHQLLGLTAGLSYLVYVAPHEYSPATLAGALAVSSLAALLPDIDTPAAKIWSYIPFGSTVGEIVDPLLGHRNLSHSLLGFGLFSLGMRWLLGLAPDYWGLNGAVIGGCFAVSLASHLISDMCTAEGLPLLYPLRFSFGIPPHPFEGMRVMTGKWFENLVIFPLINVILLAVLYLNWETVKVFLFK